MINLCNRKLQSTLSEGQVEDWNSHSSLRSTKSAQMTNHSQARQEDQGCVLLSLAEERRETKKSSWKDSTSLGSRGLGSGYNDGKEQNACG